MDEDVVSEKSKEVLHVVHEKIIVELFKDGCCDTRTLIEAK